MAIKGKGRSKRRGVAAAPKPAFVQPKRPLLSRRGFQIGVLAALVVITLASITAALIVKHNDNKKQALEDTERSIVQKFGAAVDNGLSPIGQPFETTFTPFPSLSPDVGSLQSGDLSSTDAIDKAGQYAQQAADAGAAIGKISVATLIEGHADLLTLSDSQTLLGDALELYGQVAQSFKLAAQAGGADQKRLIAHTQSLAAVASKIFSDGYQKLINERTRFDLLTPTNQQGAPTPAIPTAPISTPTA
ncbi:MAG: hypothetical protein ABR600_10875 [Actinomycetota bacterium]